MPGDEQRQQLIAQLVVVHAGAVLEARGDELGEDVLALADERIRAALADLLGEDRVDAGAQRRDLGERPFAPEPPREQHAELEPGRGGPVEQLAQQAAQTVAALLVADAEHRAQDHLERDRLHARVDRERPPGRPGGQLPLGRLAHDRLVRAHPLAVEGRQHQAAAVEVLTPFEQQHRPRAEQRAQRERAARREPVVTPRVERAHDLRVRQHHHR